ncbi:glycosyltransferase family 4 protein [Eubacterium maltosivorans]|uniref:Glycosyltransferase family 1 protein n=1 Tax=Eubacterium maltosivorans TaxID=2041044 RepID=A0A4P9C488_EUBML|nr:glycosyltransferase family 4 protein [Eubacterium maltosivorans]QCT70189.1 hypothetical protein CPZ25_002290 [Eubacterium maltosivorans]
MKILMLVPSFEEKGPVIVAENICRYSENKKIRYCFCSLRKNPPEIYKNIIKEFNNTSCKIVELGMKKIPSFKTVKEIEKLIEEEEIDIVHTHAFWPTVLASNIKNKKIIKITTVHNNPFEDYFYEYGKIIGSLMSNMFTKKLNGYDNVIAISKYINNIYERYQIASTVIYNGIEDYYKTKHIEKKVRFRLITVSILNEIKNVIELLKILNECINQDLNIELVIIGDGKEYDCLKEYVQKNNLESYIFFMKQIERKKVFEELYYSDAFIFASKSEGFGLAVVEAEMMELPIIAYDIPVMHEIMKEETGYIVHNMYDAVKVIKELVKDKALVISKGKAARKFYLESFTIEKMIKKYEDLYQLYEEGRKNEYAY